MALTLERSLAGETISLDMPIDMKTKDAGSSDVFTSFGEMLAAVVFIDAEVSGRVTLDRKKVPLHEVLDEMCAQVGCVWSLDTKGPKPRLFIHAKKS